MRFQSTIWIGLAAVVYQLLYHAQAVAAIKLFSDCIVLAKQNQQDLAIFLGCF